MIYNGNYYYSTFENIKDSLIDAYVKYYGEEYRDQIQTKINEFKYYPFHSADYVNSYYFSYIKKFREEILDRFVENINNSGLLDKHIERNETLDNLMFDTNEDIYNSDVFYACEVGPNIFDDDSFTDEARKEIMDAREKIASTFDLNLNKNDFYKKLLDIRRIFNESVREIENENTCDVFKDYQTIEKNTLKNFKDYLYECKKQGYKLTSSDEEKLNDKNFVFEDLYQLDCFGTLFSSGLIDGGLSKYFLTTACEDLESKKTDSLLKLKIISKRLQYLTYFKDTELKYLTKDKLIDIVIKIQKSLGEISTVDTEESESDENSEDNQDLDTNSNLSTKDKISKFIYNLKNSKNPVISFEEKMLLIKEYNYQKSHCPENFDGFSISHDELKKSWEKGEFCPRNMADIFNLTREEYLKKIENNTLYQKNADENKDYYEEDDISDYYTLRQFKNNDLFKPLNRVFVCEEYYPNLDSYLGILIHELNHIIATDVPYEVNSKDIKLRCGILLDAREKQKYNIIGEIISDSYTENVAEYINERQTQEIKDIFYDIMKERSIVLPNDNVLNPENYVFNCSYDYYGFLLEDFYECFNQIFKISCVNNYYDMFFKYNLPVNKFQELLDKPLNTFNRVFNRTNYFDGTGLLDVHKVQKLNALVDDFKNIQKFLPVDCTPDDLFNPDIWDALKIKKDIQEKLLTLLYKKEKIMAELIKDLNTKIKLDNLSKKQKVINYGVLKNGSQENDADSTTQDSIENSKVIPIEKSQEYDVDWSDLNELIRKKWERENFAPSDDEKFID